MAVDNKLQGNYRTFFFSSLNIHPVTNDAMKPFPSGPIFLGKQSKDLPLGQPDNLVGQHNLPRRFRDHLRQHGGARAARLQRRSGVGPTEEHRHECRKLAIYRLAAALRAVLDNDAGLVLPSLLSCPALQLHAHRRHSRLHFGGHPDDFSREIGENCLPRRARHCDFRRCL